MIIALFAAGFALMLQGCSSLGPIRQETVTIRPQVTNYVDVVVTKTNIVLSTNTVATTVGGETRILATPVTNVVVTVSTNSLPVVIPAVTYQSNYIAAPWQTASSAIGAVAPLPWASVAVTGLLALTTTALGYMNRRNAAKARASLDALGEVTIVAETLVDNFESLRKAALEIPAYKTSMDSKVMDAVKLVQRVAGVKGHIDKLVDDRTENTL